MINEMINIIIFIIFKSCIVSKLNGKVVLTSERLKVECNDYLLIIVVLKQIKSVLTQRRNLIVIAQLIGENETVLI